MKSVCLLMLLALVALPASAQSRRALTAEPEVRKTLSDFIQAFDTLDSEKFRAAFADDATVFYPRGVPPRADGRAEFEQTFRLVFEQIRAGRETGPYMDLKPRDLKIQLAGEVAIATFHLEDRPGFLNRRTVVLEKRSNGWKI